MTSDPQDHSGGAGSDRAPSCPTTTRWSPTDRTLTYAELHAEVRRAAAAMIDLGVGAGDRVAIWSPNTWHWVVAAWPSTTPAPPSCR